MTADGCDRNDLFNIENLVLGAGSVPPVAALPVKIATCFGVLKYWSVGKTKARIST
jgi:hypothetical protein